MSKLKIGILGASRGMDFAMRILPGQYVIHVGNHSLKIER